MQRTRRRPRWTTRHPATGQKHADSRPLLQQSSPSHGRLVGSDTVFSPCVGPSELSRLHPHRLRCPGVDPARPQDRLAPGATASRFAPVESPDQRATFSTTLNQTGNIQFHSSVSSFSFSFKVQLQSSASRFSFKVHVPLKQQDPRALPGGFCCLPLKLPPACGCFPLQTL